MLLSLAASALLLLYAACAAAILAYTAAQLHLLAVWWRDPPGRSPAAATPGGRELPAITVQLPLYNEVNVARRLLRCAAALDWPRDRLEIQVLDDSSDETTALVAEEAAALRAAGLDVTHLRRGTREGYKAGALAAGLAAARGELIAIFDADFLPPPCFLRRAHAALSEDVGLVQGRWGHLNRRASALTRTQAFHLDAHFTLEQHARGNGGLLMGFNGTAGLWRRACIEDAGGWAIDTLTEDLDLAYRAQLAGWRLRYVDALEAPAELPAEMPAIRAQQHRWMKGNAQVARKLLRRLLAAPLPARRRAQGAAHLLGSAVFLAVLGLCLLNPLAGPLSHRVSWLPGALALAAAPLKLALPTLLAVYLTACAHRAGSLARGAARVAAELPLLLLFCTGLSLHNSLAVVEGWRGETGAFVRTPKAGDAGAAGLARYRAARAVGGRLAWALEAGSWGAAAWRGFQALGFLAVQRQR